MAGKTLRKPRSSKPRQAEPGFWRVSTLTRRNVELAIEFKQWGTQKGIGMRRIKPGDRVVFYVSGGRHAGYLGTARVTSEPFVSQTPVWPDDIYPVRFRLAPDGPTRLEPVASEVVRARLGGRRLTFLRQAGVIPLTAAEYRTIADLLAKEP